MEGLKRVEVVNTILTRPLLEILPPYLLRHDKLTFVSGVNSAIKPIKRSNIQQLHISPLAMHTKVSGPRFLHQILCLGRQVREYQN